MKPGRLDTTSITDVDAGEPVGLVEPRGPNAVATSSKRRPGRPLEMSADEVLVAIRWLAGREEGLFRIHRAYPALYARARRLFGSWHAAVRTAGVDYQAHQGAAKARSLRNRRRNRRSRVSRTR